MPPSQLIVPDLNASSHPSRYTGRPGFEVEVTHVSLSEVLAAMSRALDLTEERVEGHTARTCVIGMRIAAEPDLSAFDKVALYGALLLKDSGCGGTTSFDDVVGEDETDPKPILNLAAIPQKTKSVIHHAGIAGRDAIIDRFAGFLRRKSRSPGFHPPILSRGERDESMALRMGFSTATADAIRFIDEHWDGSGPDRKRDRDIPLFSRIILLSQTVDAFVTQRGLQVAMRMSRERSEQWFDPNLVRVVRGWREETGWWASLMSLYPRQGRPADHRGAGRDAEASSVYVGDSSEGRCLRCFRPHGGAAP